jgi:nicotinamidase-related amidase
MRTAVRIPLAVALVIAAQLVTARPSGAAEPSKAPAAPAQPGLELHPGRTALLVMDYQNDIVGMLPAQEQGPLLDRAAALVAEARRAGVPVIYVVVRFREGYPEVSAASPRFAALKQSGRLREGTPGAEIHPRVAPRPGDVVVTKRRVGAFSTTDLETILRARGVDTLLLAGISTSGVVLSTVRWAADMDYRLAVVADACADFDPEVHRVLAQKVFPGQATVLSTAEALKALGPSR